MEIFRQFQQLGKYFFKTRHKKGQIEEKMQAEKIIKKQKANNSQEI